MKEGEIGMGAPEAIEMMARARNEIDTLRRQVEHLTPRADAYDKLAIVLNLLPKRSEGASEDLSWRLGKRMDELKAEMEAAQAKPSQVVEPAIKPYDDSFGGG